MTYTSINNQKQKLINFNKSTTDNVNLIVRGQGIVVFKANQRCSLNFINKYDKLGLKVQFTNEFIIVTMKPTNEPLIDSKNCKGLIKNEGAYYWFSLDSQNLRLYAGIGETREENIIYS
jgi:hypothetical protein